MPVSKLKNLVIVILLLANVALLCVLLPRQAEQRRQDQALRSQLSSLCADQDVLLDPDSIPATVTLYTLELADSEHAQAETPVRLGMPSSACQWENDVITLEPEGQKEVSDFRAAAKKVLKELDFHPHQIGTPVRLQPGIYSVTAKQSILGVPVFSEGLTLTYSNSCLTKIEGTFYTGTLTRTNDGACIGAADAVVAFLAARVELGWVGSSITSLEQGYLCAELSSSVTRLTPVWYLHTDTGAFYVNGVTSQVFAVS